ncbi:hypothetical protein Goari_016806 [Gossypium aridum]|uniref:Uncharacterized protein n=1 Tax=Gossypium aridum TaxID=34290 RepID=A0A7J8WK27_GOSAI|nr:hypothetical protein [Gossypium aridum]
MFLAGSLPDFHKSSSLVSLRLANTGLPGLLPESIWNLQSLSVLDVSYFSFSGKIPNSLANLTELTALLLYGLASRVESCHQRHNGFHGAMGSPKSNEFPELRNIDLSFNEFVGRLPSLHFQRWNAMQVVDVGKLNYLQANISFEVPQRNWNFNSSHAMTMTMAMAGVKTKYDKIQECLVAIDLSRNKFEGSIPQSFRQLTFRSTSIIIGESHGTSSFRPFS